MSASALGQDVARQGAAPGIEVSAAAGLPLFPEDQVNGLPAPLTLGDAALYREIFALQHRGDWTAADLRIARLADRRLIGHVLAQRYLHPTAYRSKYKELQEWMARYADHPDARRIYKLALKRRPSGASQPAPPAAASTARGGPVAVMDEPYRSTKRLSKAERRRAAQFKRQIRLNVLRTRLTVTEKLLTGARARQLLDQVEIDDGFTQVAAAWFYYGNAARGHQLADAAAHRSGAEVPIAHWIAGLAAWRLGRLDDAADHFERLAQSKRSSDWNVAAGAYWAARAHLRLRHPAQMSEWLGLAARYPRTFYGLLAQRALGLQLRFEYHNQAFDPVWTTRLEAEPAAARALALLQIGEHLRAEQELKRIEGWADLESARALLALAERAGLPQIAFRLGNRLAAADYGPSADGLLDVALYPIPPWKPDSGFTVDRALIYALIRQESAFNPLAKSPDGARGLMQLMPSTASFIARDRRFRRSKRQELFDPATNIELGQRYITHLLDHAQVRGDLFRLVTAYNGGPGNLGKWQRKMEYGDDPLMFIESLPSRETRLFIERVLSNLWIYRARLGQENPSLDGLASGDWPRYVPLDNRSPELVHRAQD